MPGSAIRDRLRQNNVSAYTGPNMSTTFEVCEDLFINRTEFFVLAYFL